MLLKYGADLSLSTELGSALHMACSQDHVDVVEFLLTQKLNLSLQDKNGDTALHVCVINGNISCLVRILNVYLSQIDQLKESEAEDQTKVEEINKQLKALLEIQNNDGNTILHESALNERQTLLEKLRRIGLADEQIKNKEGKTAREIEYKLKEQHFKEEVEKQKQITESRQKKKQVQQERQMMEEQLRKEEEEQDERDRLMAKRATASDPAAEAKRFRLIAVFFFLLFLIAAYFLLDFVAKNKEKSS